MRVPVALGFFFALGAGIIGMAIVVAVLSGQPPIAPTLPPTGTPLALVTPSPVPTAEPTATPTQPGASPSSSGDPSVTIGTAIGQRAPEFVLPHLAGGEISSADSHGKALWVNFMASWCPQCQDELPMMSLYKFQVGDAMDVLLVDVGEDQETVLNFMTGLQIDLPTALDEQGTVQAQWGANALPVHFWLDADGVVREIVFGGAPRSVFQAAIQKVVPEASFSPEP